MIIVIVAVEPRQPEQGIRRELDFPDDASVYVGTPEVFAGAEGTKPLRGAVVVRHFGGSPIFTNQAIDDLVQPREPLQALASDLLAREVARALPALEGYRHLDDLKRALEACGELAVSNRLKPYDCLEVGGKIVGKVERDEV